MNKSPELNRNKLGRRTYCLLTLSALGLVSTSVSAFRPDIFASVYNQAYDVFNPEPTVAASSPAATPTTHSTPTPTQVSTKENSPTPTPNKLGSGNGQKPVSISWQTSGINIVTGQIEIGETPYDAAEKAKSLIWAKSQPGACAAEGVTWVGAHSSPVKGRALVQPSMPEQLRLTGEGSMIWLTTEDGTKCGYKVEWFKSVTKKGEGPGTFSGLMDDNPAGRNLFDQDGDPALVFATCDTESDRVGGHSLNNDIVFAPLVEVIPPKE